ncbi:MAG: hypothetical protein KME16_09335 [Scytolyngbya sp. HA4215-MV1]|nr:hypothetical protein [Scytolyngbya sp. HA4215-MV1]
MPTTCSLAVLAANQRSQNLCIERTHRIQVIRGDHPESRKVFCDRFRRSSFEAAIVPDGMQVLWQSPVRKNQQDHLIGKAG